MIKLEPDIMELAENAETREQLKTILLENHIDFTDVELNELAGMLEIPHG